MRGVRVRFRDPNRVNLRKAGRALLVVPGVFAGFVVAGNSSAALFAAFGSFAALVFADFGGPMPRRFRAYLGLAAVGAALGALGTAVADRTVIAAVVTVVVVFGVSFAGALGGYFAAGGTAATLAFVLAVMTPGVDADLWSRELGWIVSVLVAGIGACVLWPVHQRDRVRAAAATVLDEAATALALPAARRDLAALRDAHATLLARIGVVYRPAGSIARERALVALVIAARRLLPLVEAVTAAETSPAADSTPEYGELRVRVATSLGASARVLDREHVADLGVDALTRARDAHTGAIEQRAAAEVTAGGAERVVAGLDASFPLRRISLAALQIADDVQTAAHEAARARADRAAAVEGGWEILRGHCNVRSVRFRNAARAGLGLALAVLVGKTASVEHAFWVVLAALSVLRSNALGTGATALQALVGALVGFGVAALAIMTIGADDAWLWVVLPVVVFLAAYTPGAVNFVVGQAAFTVFVVVLFNLLVPEGWRTGLVRVQDIAIGAGISVAVGALLWPRGARGVARRSFAELLHAGGAHLSLSVDVALRGAPGDPARAAEAVTDARSRAVAALEDLALERGGGQVDREAWGLVLVEALLLELAADGITRGRRDPPARGCRDAVDELLDERDAVVRSVDAEADELVRAGIAHLAPARPRLSPIPGVLTRCLDAGSTADVRGALRLVWTHEWLALAAEHPWSSQSPSARVAR